MNKNRNIAIVIAVILYLVACICSDDSLIQIIGLVSAPFLLIFLMQPAAEAEFTPTHYRLVKGILFMKTGTWHSIKNVQKAVLRKYSYIERGDEDTEDARQVIFQVYVVRNKKYDKVFTSTSLMTARKYAEDLTERYGWPLEGKDIADME